MAAGRGIDLPNYPPMVIGGAEVAGDLLYVGVADGSHTTQDNRFLMKYGFEIYDIAIWDRPVRLSQVRTDQPVSGLVTFGKTAYLASGSDGLVIVDIHDPTRPLVLGNIGVPGNIATDVALNKNLGLLAMSVAHPLDGGYIRFFAVTDPDLDPPTGYGTISLTDGELQGTPLDIQWQDERLFVLLNRDGQLYLVVFEDIAGERRYSIQSIERGRLSGPQATNAAFAVQYGQIAVTTGREFLILQPAEG
jgi:hypothetical protein